MRASPIIVVLLALGGCATEAQQETSRLQGVVATGRPEVEACDKRVEQSAPYQALRDRLGPRDGAAPLALKANQDKATQAEVQELYALHQDYLTPCRKLRLETASKIHPAMVAVLAEAFSKYDADLVRLTTRQISWGEYLMARDAISAETQAKIAAVGSAMQKNLNEAHASEVARRQAAASALGQWAQQQQVILQNQQMINAMNQPRMTNCQYVGTYLNCTTF
jgi:hypothetical protein